MSPTFSCFTAAFEYHLLEVPELDLYSWKFIVSFLVTVMKISNISIICIVCICLMNNFESSCMWCVCVYVCVHR